MIVMFIGCSVISLFVQKWQITKTRKETEKVLESQTDQRLSFALHANKNRESIAYRLIHIGTSESDNDCNAIFETVSDWLLLVLVSVDESCLASCVFDFL
jgi:hypothetical protein